MWKKCFSSFWSRTIYMRSKSALLMLAMDKTQLKSQLVVGSIRRPVLPKLASDSRQRVWKIFFNSFGCPMPLMLASESKQWVWGAQFFRTSGDGVFVRPKAGRELRIYFNSFGCPVMEFFIRPKFYIDYRTFGVVFTSIRQLSTFFISFNCSCSSNQVASYLKGFLFEEILVSSNYFVNIKR